MPLYRKRVTFEFCIDAPDEQAAEDAFERGHAMAISDGRCGRVDESPILPVTHEAQLHEQTLSEVPLEAFDYTAQERLEREPS